MLDDLRSDLQTARTEMAAQRDLLNSQLAALDGAIAALSDLGPARPRDMPRSASGAVGSTCPECGKQYPTAHGLTLHLSKTHGVKGAARAPKTAGTFACDRCGRRFNRPNGLTRHLNESHGAKPSPTATPGPAPVVAPAPGPSGQPTHVNANEVMAARTPPLRPAPVAGIGDELECDECDFTCHTQARLLAHLSNAHKGRTA